MGLISDGSILIHNGVIASVGPTRRVENMADARQAREINAAGRVVMPAFVDCHACICPIPLHSGHRTPRGAENAAKPLATLPGSRLETQAEQLLRIMARHGTATLAAVSGYGADTSGELKALRVLKALHQQPLDIIPVVNRIAAGTPNAAEFIDCGLLETVARRKLAGLAGVRSGEGSLNLSQAAAVLHEARSLGFQLRLEGESPDDAALIALAIANDALSISNIHTRRMADMELLSNASTFTIQMPARVHPKFPPESARLLLESGALVALATGLSPEHPATASMQTVIEAAVELLQMTAAEAIAAATINAAWAIGEGARTGSLEHGKRADILLLNADDYREIPLLRGTTLAHSLIKRGVILFEEEFPGWPERN